MNKVIVMRGIYTTIKDNAANRSGVGTDAITKFPYYWTMHDLLATDDAINPPAGTVGDSHSSDHDIDGAHDMTWTISVDQLEHKMQQCY